MTLQEAVRKLRIELGITQTELASRLNVNYTTLSRWEHGRAFPKREIAAKVLRKVESMDVSVECKTYLESVLRPTRRRVKSARDYGFPELDQELLCQAADGAPHSICIIDIATKDVLYVNRICEEMFDFNFLEQKDRKCYRIIKHRDQPCENCTYTDIHGDCNRKNPKELIMTSAVGNRILRGTGKETVWNGKRVFVSYISDVTDIVHMRDGLTKFMNSLPSGTGVYNLYFDGRIEMVYLNDGFYEIFESEPAKQGDISTFPIFKYIDPTECKSLKKALLLAAKENKMVNLEFSIHISELRVKKLILKARPLEQDNDKCVFCFTITDISELEQISDGVHPEL